MTRLHEFLGMLHIPCKDTRVIKGISDDSREVEKDWLFVCRSEQQAQRSTHIAQALAKGAVVLTQKEAGQDVYSCEQLETIIEALLTLYYGDICAELTLIGITGTSGKTSVACVITQLLRAHHFKVLRIGTHEVDDGKMLRSIRNTTPDRFQLMKLLSRAKQEGMTHVVMEVSSHAIDQNRISNLRFDVLVYTNITQDHLDYHLTKLHYRYTKFKLRRYVKKTGVIVINGDHEELKELSELSDARMVTVGKQAAQVRIERVVITAQGSTYELLGKKFSTQLLGRMNVENTAQALVACRLLGCALESLQAALPQIPCIAGRMERIAVQNFAVWIDYAHTPDAVASMLSFARSVCTGRLYVILGCGGERDQSKRQQMADAACQYSDLAIFTSDNPRREPISKILSDMCQTTYPNYEVFENRYFAIKYTIKIAKDSDIIVIAGKGNEKTQEINGKYYPFDDTALVKQHFAKEELLWK